MVTWEVVGFVRVVIRLLAAIEKDVVILSVRKMISLTKDDFFTSDQHFGHRNVIKYCRRPFAINMDDPTFDEVTAMNDYIVKVYNEVVKGRRCFHVGDFSLALNWVDIYGPKLLGDKPFYPGNHDWVHPLHAKKPQKMARAVARFKEAGFEVQDVQGLFTYEGLKIKVCHLPYWEDAPEGATYEGRYKELRPTIGDEDILICGHVHTAWKIRRMNDGTFMYNVGVDQHNFKPVSIEEIVKSIKAFTEE